jgi:UPF0271 protein
MAFDPSLAFLVLSSSALERAVKDRGGRVVRLFLADLGFLSNGQLAPRGQPGAVIHDVGAVIARVLRVLRVLRDARIETLDGPDIAMPVQSVLIHSDTAGALTLAQQLKAALIAEGISPTPMSRHI